MLRKKQFMTGFMTAVMTVGMFSTSAFAANHSDSALPTEFVGHYIQTGVRTELRRKDDASSHYVYNTAGFDYWVYSYSPDNTNLTINLHAVVPSNSKRRVRNSIYERGYRSCRLLVTAADESVVGKVHGLWSPDCVGDYPAGN